MDQPLLLLLVLCTVTLPANAQSLQTYEGYLTDRRCLDLRDAPDGTNMVTQPERHTVHCALLQSCIDSGYAILLAPTTASLAANTYAGMYNLSATSNQIAEAFLWSLPDSRRNIKVRVLGHLLATSTGSGGQLLHIGNNDALSVPAIQDIGAADPQGEVSGSGGSSGSSSLANQYGQHVTGYIVDRLCLDLITALDGANMQTNPEDHTVHCLLVPKCIASNFAIMLPKRKNHQGTILEAGYGAFYNFSTHRRTGGQDANAAIVDWLKTKADDRSNVLVTVNITLDENGVASFADVGGGGGGTGSGAPTFKDHGEGSQRSLGGGGSSSLEANAVVGIIVGAIVLLVVVIAAVSQRMEGKAKYKRYDKEIDISSSDGPSSNSRERSLSAGGSSRGGEGPPSATATPQSYHPPAVHQGQASPAQANPIERVDRRQSLVVPAYSKNEPTPAAGAPALPKKIKHHHSREEMFDTI